MVMHDARGASCLYHHFFLPFVAQQESVCNTLYACHLTLFSSDYFTGESIRRSALAVIRTSSVWLCTSFSAALVFCHANLAAASQTENSPHVSPVATNGTHWSIQLANFVSFAGTFINRKLDENDPHIQTFIQYGGVRQFLPVLSDSSVEKEKEMETFKNATIFQRAQVSLDKGLRSTSSSFEDLE